MTVTSYKAGSFCTDRIFKINVGDGPDHIVLTAIRRHLVGKLDTAVESDDRALSLESPDIRSYRGACNAEP